MDGVDGWSRRMEWMDGVDRWSRWLERMEWMDGRMDGNDSREYERTLNVRCPGHVLIIFMSFGNRAGWNCVSSTINMIVSITQGRI